MGEACIFCVRGGCTYTSQNVLSVRCTYTAAGAKVLQHTIDWSSLLRYTSRTLSAADHPPAAALSILLLLLLHVFLLLFLLKELQQQLYFVCKRSCCWNGRWWVPAMFAAVILQQTTAARSLSSNTPSSTCKEQLMFFISSASSKWKKYIFFFVAVIFLTVLSAYSAEAASAGRYCCRCTIPIATAAADNVSSASSDVLISLPCTTAAVAATYTSPSQYTSAGSGLLTAGERRYGNRTMKCLDFSASNSNSNSSSNSSSRSRSSSSSSREGSNSCCSRRTWGSSKGSNPHIFIKNKYNSSNNNSLQGRRSISPHSTAHAFSRRYPGNPPSCSLSSSSYSSASSFMFSSLSRCDSTLPELFFLFSSSFSINKAFTSLSFHTNPFSVSGMRLISPLRQLHVSSPCVVLSAPSLYSTHECRSQAQPASLFFPSSFISTSSPLPSVEESSPSLHSSLFFVLSSFLFIIPSSQRKTGTASTAAHATGKSRARRFMGEDRGRRQQLEEEISTKFDAELNIAADVAAIETLREEYPLRLTRENTQQQQTEERRSSTSSRSRRGRKEDFLSPVPAEKQAVQSKRAPPFHRSDIIQQRRRKAFSPSSSAVEEEIDPTHLLWTADDGTTPRRARGKVIVEEEEESAAAIAAAAEGEDATEEDIYETSVAALEEEEEGTEIIKEEEEEEEDEGRFPSDWGGLEADHATDLQREEEEDKEEREEEIEEEIEEEEDAVAAAQADIAAKRAPGREEEDGRRFLKRALAAALIPRESAAADIKGRGGLLEAARSGARRKKKSISSSRRISSSDIHITTSSIRELQELQASALEEAVPRSSSSLYKPLRSYFKEPAAASAADEGLTAGGAPAAATGEEEEEEEIAAKGGTRVGEVGDSAATREVVVASRAAREIVGARGEEEKEEEEIATAAAAGRRRRKGRGALKEDIQQQRYKQKLETAVAAAVAASPPAQVTEPPAIILGDYYHQGVRLPRREVAAVAVTGAAPAAPAAAAVMDGEETVLPFPLDMQSEEELQEARRMPTQEERIKDKQDYFGSDNVNKYHRFNPDWTPYQESNYLPSHDFEASAVGHYGISPQRPLRESDMAQPSVPYAWRVYAAICLYKLPLLLAAREREIEERLKMLQQHREQRRAGRYQQQKQQQQQQKEGQQGQQQNSLEQQQQQQEQRVKQEDIEDMKRNKAFLKDEEAMIKGEHHQGERDDDEEKEEEEEQQQQQEQQQQTEVATQIQTSLKREEEVKQIKISKEEEKITQKSSSSEEEEEEEEERRWILKGAPSEVAAAAEVLDMSVHPRFHYPFLTWARLSTRLPDATAKMLEIQRMQMLSLPQQQQQCWQRRVEGTGIGDLLIFAAPTLHHGHHFLQTNPKIKAGLYSEVHMYQLADVTAEHLLLGKGERRTAERDRTYLALGFFIPPPTQSQSKQQIPLQQPPQQQQQQQQQRHVPQQQQDVEHEQQHLHQQQQAMQQQALHQQEQTDVKQHQQQQQQALQQQHQALQQQQQRNFQQQQQDLQHQQELPQHQQDKDLQQENNSGVSGQLLHQSSPLFGGTSVAAHTTHSSQHEQQQQQQQQQQVASHIPAASTPGETDSLFKTADLLSSSHSEHRTATGSWFVATATAEQRSPAHALLQEKHLRFLCRSNCVEKRGLLLSPQLDTLADLLLPPEQLLPMTDAQRSRVYVHWKRRNAKASIAAAAAKHASFLLLQRLQHEHRQQHSTHPTQICLQQPSVNIYLLQQAVKHLVLESLCIYSAIEPKKSSLPPVGAAHLLEKKQQQEQQQHKQKTLAHATQQQRNICPHLWGNMNNPLTAEEKEDHVLLAKRAAAAVLLRVVATGEPDDGGSLAVVERLASLDALSDTNSNTEYSHTSSNNESSSCSTTLSSTDKDGIDTRITTTATTPSSVRPSSTYEEEKNEKRKGAAQSRERTERPTSPTTDTAATAGINSTKFQTDTRRTPSIEASRDATLSTASINSMPVEQYPGKAAESCQHISLLRETLQLLFPHYSAAAIRRLHMYLRTAVTSHVYGSSVARWVQQQQQRVSRQQDTETTAQKAQTASICKFSVASPAHSESNLRERYGNTVADTESAASAAPHNTVTNISITATAATTPRMTESLSDVCTDATNTEACPDLSDAANMQLDGRNTSYLHHDKENDICLLKGERDGKVESPSKGIQTSDIKLDSLFHITTEEKNILQETQNTAETATIARMLQYAAEPVVCTSTSVLPGVHQHPEVLEREAALAEMLYFFAEDEEEAREFVRRAPYTRGRVYKSVFLCQATRVDFYGKCRDMIMPNPSTGEDGELEIDEEGFCVEKYDHVDWLIERYLRNVHKQRPHTAEARSQGKPHIKVCGSRRHDNSGRDVDASSTTTTSSKGSSTYAAALKAGEVIDASVLLDRPFYREYLRDWAFLHLPEGEYLSEPLHVTGQDESGDIPDPAVVTALSGNRVEDYAREYVPGVWLYKPETKILYNDTETGSILFGSGIDGTFSWDKPVDKRTMVDALIRMEMAAEHVRKGHFTWDDNLWTRVSTNPQLTSHMSQEEEARLKWGLQEFDLSPGELQPGDHVPTGMDFLCDKVMEGKPPEYQRLMEYPDVVHNIHQHWMQRVDRGEAWLSDDPFRLSPQEIDIRDRVAAIEDAPPNADLPEVTTWQDDGI